MGLMPGPDMPPNLLPMAGRKVSVSIFSPRMVLDTTKASAPAFSAALAMATMSPALGDSLAHSGFSVAARMPVSTSKACSSCSAKLPPPGARVGQEMLTSITSTPGTLTSLAMAAKSSAVSAEMLATSGGVNRL